MNTFLVAYDIADPKRLARVAKILKGRGERLQFSVFLCDLDQRGVVELRVSLAEEINHDEDQVVFVDLGPADGRGGTAITSIGKVVEDAEAGAVVI